MGLLAAAADPLTAGILPGDIDLYAGQAACRIGQDERCADAARHLGIAEDQFHRLELIPCHTGDFEQEIPINELPRFLRRRVCQNDGYVHIGGRRN